MNLYLRLILMIIRLIFTKRTLTDAHQTVTVTFRVLPNDIDLNRHMNNGRYLTIMDLARIHFMGASGLMKVIVKKRWMPVLGGAHLIFLRPLKCFQQYTIHTKLEHWDDKWFVVTQRFESNGKTCAFGIVRGLFRGKDGNVNPHELLKLAGFENVEPPAMSPLTQQWVHALETQLIALKS